MKIYLVVSSAPDSYRIHKAFICKDKAYKLHLKLSNGHKEFMKLLERYDARERELWEEFRDIRKTNEILDEEFPEYQDFLKTHDPCGNWYIRELEVDDD